MMIPGKKTLVLARPGDTVFVQNRKGGYTMGLVVSIVSEDGQRARLSFRPFERGEVLQGEARQMNSGDILLVRGRGAHYPYWVETRQEPGHLIPRVFVRPLSRMEWSSVQMQGVLTRVAARDPVEKAKEQGL